MEENMNGYNVDESNNTGASNNSEASYNAETPVNNSMNQNEADPGAGIIDSGSGTTPLYGNMSADIPNYNSSNINTKKNGLSKKQIRIIAIVGAAVVVVIVAVIIILTSVAKQNYFKSVKLKAHMEYPNASIKVGADGSYLSVDTNPSDQDADDLSLSERVTLLDVSNDSISAIEMINSELGLSDAVYQNMLKTTSLQGRQTAETTKYTVSWSYHPDNGLEVIYERK